MELSPLTMRSAVEKYLNDYPRAKLRSATSVYNCMGLVFGSRRTWIFPDQLTKILTDDEYKKLSGPEEVEIGDVVIYHDEEGRPNHIGVVTDKSFNAQLNPIITVTSQWGAAGEYIHPVDGAPEFYGRRVEYWTDRRPKP